jgi:hypothetical protein
VSDERIAGPAQSVVDGVTGDAGTIVDQTLAKTDPIVDQTLAKTDGIVDQTLAKTDPIVDQTLAKTDGIVEQTVGGTRARVDEAVGHTGAGKPTGATPGDATGDNGAATPPPATPANDPAAPPADAAPRPSSGGQDPTGGHVRDTPSAGTHDSFAGPTAPSPRQHGDPTAVAPPDLSSGSDRAEALAAAPSPDGLSPPPTSGTGSFLEAMLDTTSDPRVMAAAGAAIAVGAGVVAIPRSAPLGDGRLMVQVGIVLGFVYAAFLSFWFWATRLRVPPHRAPGAR